MLERIETRCVLANPTNIRDMDAMLFDVQCAGGDGTVLPDDADSTG